MAEKKTNEKPEPVHQPVEAWRDALGTPAWLFAAAKTKHNWPVGVELTEADYRSAIRATEQEVIR